MKPREALRYELDAGSRSEANLYAQRYRCVRCGSHCSLFKGYTSVMNAAGKRGKICTVCKPKR